MRTFVYIDVFNLYYRALRNTPYRWLDLSKLARLLLPKNQIHRIHYYTARITARPGDPDQPTRQQFYLRALATIPNVSITYGQFLTHKKKGSSSRRVGKNSIKNDVLSKENRLF